MVIQAHIGRKPRPQHLPVETSAKFSIQLSSSGRKEIPRIQGGQTGTGEHCYRSSYCNGYIPVPSYLTDRCRYQRD